VVVVGVVVLADGVEATDEVMTAEEETAVVEIEVDDVVMTRVLLIVVAGCDDVVCNSNVVGCG